MHYRTFPVLAQNADLFVESLKEYAPGCTPLVMEPNEMRVLD